MGERDEPWCHVLAVSSLHTASANRCTYSVGCGICSRPGATGTGSVRREASARKQDKSPGADGESNSSGREEGHMPLKEKNSCQWPWGGIVVREVFRRWLQIEYYTTVLR